MKNQEFQCKKCGLFELLYLAILHKKYPGIKCPKCGASAVHFKIIPKLDEWQRSHKMKED